MILKFLSPLPLFLRGSLSSVLTFLLGFLGQFLIYVLSNWARIIPESSCYCHSSDKKLGCWLLHEIDMYPPLGSDKVMGMLYQPVTNTCCCQMSMNLCATVAVVQVAPWFSVFLRIEVSFLSACSYHVGSEISLTLQLVHPSILFSLI